MRARKSAPDRRADILHATFALAFEVGPEQVTTGMIAKRLGLTQPAIYKHFPSKDDIWRSAAQILSDQISANITQAEMQAADPIAQLQLLVLGHLNLVCATPALPEIMVARDPKGLRHQARQQIRSSMTAFFKALTRAVKEAQAGGYLCAETAPQDIATLIIGIIQSLVLRLLVTRDPSILLSDGKRLLDLQLSAFAATAGATSQGLIEI
ncbi:MAG: TetR/AcrR family transcriptional regulator [Rhodobacteraceae bacterium]|nr:TetR/AcrR family transcriptional regulator [Paracoccaceae bacterium]